jgi:hypothetical protein
MLGDSEWNLWMADADSGGLWLYDEAWMGPHSDWNEVLPMPRGGKFYPEQAGAGSWPKVPGCSCVHCGCLIGRKGWRTIHLWNKSMFCRPWRGDFHMAQPYRGE